MRIDPLTAHPACFRGPGSHCASGRRFSGGHPGSWNVPGAQWAVPLHHPVVGHDGTIYQADNRKVLALDPGSGQEKFTIPGDEVGVPVRFGEQLVCCERQAVFALDPATRQRTWRVALESGWGKKAVGMNLSKRASRPVEESDDSLGAGAQAQDPLIRSRTPWYDET